MYINTCMLGIWWAYDTIHVANNFKAAVGGGVVLKSQVSPDLVESYLAEDTRKRRTLLTKYVDKCTSHLVSGNSTSYISSLITRGL